MIFKTQFYHGTSSVHFENILAEGLRQPYLTDSMDLAEYYAECETDENGGETVVLKVNVTEEIHLRADDCSLSEPVSHDGVKAWEMEQNVSAFYEQQDYDENDWKNSLLLVGSCRYDGTITDTREIEHED